MEGEALHTNQSFEINVGGKVDAVLIDGAALDAAGGIGERFADIGDRELDPFLLERVGQETKSGLFNRAFARVGIGGLEVVGFLVFLLRKRCRGCDQPHQQRNEESAHREPRPAGATFDLKSLIPIHRE